MRVDYQKPLVIFGAGPFAELMIHHFRQDTSAQVAALTVDREYLPDDAPYGLPVCAFECVGDSFPPETHDMFLAIGYKRMRERKRLFQRAKSLRYKLVNFMSTHALVHEPGRLGENNVFLDHSLIEPFSSIGDNNIFWSGSTICHGTRVGDHNFIASGTIIGGDCVLGNCCFLGFGATVIERVRVADESFLGAGTLVLRDTEASTKYIGHPAVAVGTHRGGGIAFAE